MKSSSVIEAKFLRSKLEAKFTGVWKNLEETKKNYINGKVELAEDEHIILYYIPNNSYWWLITNKNLIHNSNGIISFYPLSGFKSISPNHLKTIDTWADKWHNRTLNIHTNKEEEINLKVEDETWAVIYSILLWIVC